MDIDEYLAALRSEGTTLGDAAETASPGAAVPTCPGWTTRDLVLHIGGVHRWAAAHVRDGRTEPVDASKEPDIVGPWPSDAALVDWYREGHEALLGVLEGAEPAVECWSFLPAPSPLAFWARRQCQETAIHRVDAESAIGTVRALEPSVAEDGIEELLLGFLGRRRRRDVSVSVTLQLVASDIDRTWVAVLGPDAVKVGPAVEVAGASASGGPACTVTGSASDLDLLLWNRRPVAGLDVTGDPSVLETWAKVISV
jgi:uncharacterized protein (TIGR03083 family)